MFLSILFSVAILASDISGRDDIPPSDTLAVAKVTADNGFLVSRTDTLCSDGTVTIIHMLQQCPGLHVGDNGGMAGLKSVSFRAMGSAHTAVYIDGVRVGNLQSGQTDLGMIGCAEACTAVVDYAQNSISFLTSRPEFDTGPIKGSIRLSAGSFGTYLPSTRLDFRLDDNSSLTAFAEGVVSRGDFCYGDGFTRVNNDVIQLRAGLDLFGVNYHVKAFFNGSERGTPGTIEWPSDDRQRDRNFYVQGRFNKNFSDHYSLKLSAKAAYDGIFYTSYWGDSQYGQIEIQLNSSHNFNIKRWWKLSLDVDLQWDDLTSTEYRASRLSVLPALSSSFHTKRIVADLVLEYIATLDVRGIDRYAFAPSFDIRFNAFDSFDVVAYARRAFRVPVFNELYYEGYGNPELVPEDAWLTDIGVDFSRKMMNGWGLKAKADVFFNLLTDKIISSPTKYDPSIWLPYNIGKVYSTGTDISAGFSHTGEWTYSADVRYSYQHAVDRTAGSHSYGKQIPFVARHTIVFISSIRWKGWKLSPFWQIRDGRTDGYGEIQSFNTFDISLSKDMIFKKAGHLNIFISASNIFDVRFEITKGYPMPGRSILCGIDFNF